MITFMYAGSVCVKERCNSSNIIPIKICIIHLDVARTAVWYRSCDGGAGLLSCTVLIASVHVKRVKIYELNIQTDIFV